MWRSTNLLTEPGNDMSCGGAAARVHDDLVGHDHRDRDRDQRLAQLLALVPAQQHLLHREPEQAGHDAPR